MAYLNYGDIPRLTKDGKDFIEKSFQDIRENYKDEVIVQSYSCELDDDFRCVFSVTAGERTEGTIFHRQEVDNCASPTDKYHRNIVKQKIEAIVKKLIISS